MKLIELAEILYQNNILLSAVNPEQFKKSKLYRSIFFECICIDYKSSVPLNFIEIKNNLLPLERFTNFLAFI